MIMFRSEIAGLRALAVLVVIFFHLKLDGFKGGFVGVDVFFVISGYLISQHILRDAQAGRFSFAQFYLRRTRRIYPALITTVVLTYVAGSLWCAPAMFHDLAKEGTHALLSIANIQYWRESHQYFAPNSDELALLHTWSLSLEEQFYLGWPIFLVFAQRIGRTFEAITAATVASLIASVVASRSDQPAAFFLTPFRIYEFGCGALVLYAERIHLPRGLSECISLAGICSIVAAACTFRSNMPYLELAMLVPSLGAAATILAGSKTLASRLIKHQAFIGIGAISYSLYLCHWPIIFFARFIFGDEIEGLWATVLLVLLMLAVATAMFLSIERTFTLRGQLDAARRRRTAIAFVTIVLGLAGITHYTFVSGGLRWRIPADQESLARLQDFPSGRDLMAPLTGPTGLNLVGDSHAMQYQTGLSHVLEHLDLNIEILVSPGCPILYGVFLKTHYRRKECESARDQSLERIAKNGLPIFLVQFWSFYDDSTIELRGQEETQPGVLQGKGTYTKLKLALESTLERFTAGGRHVLLVGSQVDAHCNFNRTRLYSGPLPHAPLPPCPPGSRDAALSSGARMNDLLNEVRSRVPGQVTLFRPVDYFCDDNECPTMNDGLWLYMDATHFTVAGSNFMVNRAEPALVRFLRSEPLQEKSN
jgi:peptidoglycan/LPS O-acetylase OafA/YrhL